MNLEDETSIERRFFDILGNNVCAAELYLEMMSRGKNTSDIVDQLKVQFYKDLGNIIVSDYVPTPLINSQRLAMFYSMRELDWTKREDFSLVKDYFCSFRR